MSCSQNPVNIKSTKQICREECSYSFEYNPNSSAIVTNMGDYLEIKVDGKNQVKFNKLNVKVNDVRIYQPSVHLFNGKQMPGEIIIQHSNPMGDSVLVCIPLVVRDGKGDSNSFFSQLIPHVSNEKNEKQNVNVSKWSLNYIVPVAPFYFYVGNYPFKPCSGKVNVIIFDSKNAATIGSSDMSTLKKLISPISYSKAQMIGGAAQTDEILLKNLLGSLGPESDKNDYYILSDCEGISGMDDGSGTKKNRKPTASDGDREGLPGFLIGLLSILVLLILGYVIYIICTNVDISQITGNKVPVAKGATPVAKGMPIVNPSAPPLNKI
jgi:carbonic anhydrase